VQQVQAGRQIFGKCQRTLWTEWLSGSVTRWPSGLLAKQPTSGTTFAATAIESEAERLELGLRLGLGPGMDI